MSNRTRTIIIILEALVLVMLFVVFQKSFASADGWTDDPLINGPGTLAMERLNDPYGGRTGLYGWGTAQYNYNYAIPRDIEYAQRVAGYTTCEDCQLYGEVASYWYSEGSDYGRGMAYTALNDFNTTYRETDWDLQPWGY